MEDLFKCPASYWHQHCAVMTMVLAWVWMAVQACNPGYLGDGGSRMESLPAWAA
jgi:hypothetical protein